MRRLAFPLTVVAALTAMAAATALGRFAWRAHLRLVEFRLDPIGSSAPGPTHPGSPPTAAPESAPRRVLLFGDSRVAGWSPLPSIDGLEVIARGVPGETTALALLRLARTLGEVRPDLVVVQVGVNDLKAIGLMPDRAAAVFARADENLQVIAGDAAGAARQVVLMTIIPPGRRDLLHRLIGDADVEGMVREANALWRGREIERVTLFDCDPVLAPGGRLDPRYQADTLHLNVLGYAALNAAIEPVLARLAAQAAPGPQGRDAGAGGAGAVAPP